jgi:ABC-type antimicrobial peptide transport system permease subunit
MVMPVFALGFGSSALIARLTRASLLEVLDEDYVRTARAKGLPERTVIIVHVLKNSMIPVVTVVGPLFAALVTGIHCRASFIPAWAVTNRQHRIAITRQGTNLCGSLWSFNRSSIWKW